MRVLLIEDEQRVAKFVERGLKAELYLVDVAPDAETASSRYEATMKHYIESKGHRPLATLALLESPGWMGLFYSLYRDIKLLFRRIYE